MGAAVQNIHTESRSHLSLVSELTAAGFVRAESSWTSYAGGRTNKIWRVGCGANSIVVKLFDTAGASDLFPNDMAAESIALQELAGTGLAPTLVGQLQTANGPCLIYQNVPGQRWDGCVMAVGTAMAKLHSLSAPPGVRDISTQPDHVMAAGRKALAHCASTQARQLENLCPPLVPMEPSRPAFLHGDIVPGNILLHAGQAMLIDWQCPASGDPCHDIAVFLSPAMQTLYGHKPLTPAQETAFHMSYDRPDVSARYQILRPYLHWQLAIHCLWKAEQGDSDYSAAAALECAALKRFND